MQAFEYYLDATTWNVTKVSGFTITSYTGTAAEAYTKEKGVTFIPISDYTLGDVNNDGKINSADALQIQRYAVHKSSVLD